MFVSKRRWILKTCGTTTPLECIEPLLQMAETLAGYINVDYLFYSRKNFKRPDLQVSPHRNFEEEVSLLDSFFDNGRAYCLGSLNRDCWYLYTYNREGGIVAPQYENVGNGLSIEPDQTIEILMTDLDPDVMAIFTKEECKNATEATQVNFQVYVHGLFSNKHYPKYSSLISLLLLLFQRSGIEKILPDMIIDDYQFEPCGYSMNGISKHEVITKSFDMLSFEL